ncbi:hypothetical protein GOAMR_20_00810 [Gordonia amarae NBRC 15530]|uniref:ABM domain-containing protein n=1 Tax=Gordonia amarae NBRC 15530 TaxID=1075090 RepID=G7GLQ9_9ACTN|nr:hypothetical protein GOAMR_20_00810 [Gordonia amarae NBRC 15530]
MSPDLAVSAVQELAQLTIVPGSAGEFEAAFGKVLPALRSASGCLGAELLRSVDVPDTYVLRVDWARLEDHTEHFPASEAGQQVFEVLKSYCAGPPHVIHVATAGVNG